MHRKNLVDWERRIKDAPAEDRMGIIHDFADSLGGDEGKIATSMLRMISMANDTESKNIERKSRADGFMFGIGFLWIVLLMLCAAGGIFLSFHDKTSNTVVQIGESTIKTSNIGAVFIFISIIGGGLIVFRTIDKLRHD